MIRAVITAGGKVQRVGFRERVQEIAREHGIVGRARNLKSGEVEIICEGERKGVENFIRAIEIKDELIEVKRISKAFEEPTGEFEYFEIEYGELPEELAESIGAGRRELIAIRETMDSNFQTLGEKTDAVGKNVVDVGNKVESGFSKMNSNFKDLDGKYDGVSQELKSMNKNISKLVGYVGALVEEAIERRKK